MRRIWSELKNDLPYLLFGLLPLFFLASILFLQDPLVWSDEAIYVDIAKGLLQTGRLASELFGNAVYGLKTVAAWYPPLYFYVLALWIKVFGSSIESVRSLSLVLASLALVACFGIAKALFKKRSLALVTLWLISTDYFFGRSSRLARMDIFNFCLLSYSYWFYLKSNGKNWRLLGSGMFSGLALLAHPLGLIGIVLITLHIVFSTKDWKLGIQKLAVFAFPILLAGVFWALSLGGYWQIFYEQWRLQVARKNQSISYTLELWQNGLIYWKWLFATFALGLLYAGLRFLFKKEQRDLFLFLGLLISGVMLLTGKEMFYPLYYQPFASLIVVSLTLETAKQRPWVEYIFWTGVALVLLVNVKLFLVTYETYGGKEQNYASYGAQISSALPKKATVYLSALPDPYFVLQNKPGLTFREFPTMFTTDKQYYELLDSADYVVHNNVFDPRLTRYLQLNELRQKSLTQAAYYDIMVTKLKPQKERQWPKK